MFDMSQLNTKQSNEIALKKKAKKKKRGRGSELTLCLKTLPSWKTAANLSSMHLRQTLKKKKKKGLPCSSNGKESACNAGDQGSIPGSGRSSEERNGYPLQYSCLENPIDREVWRAIAHRVAKSQTRLSD